MGRLWIQSDVANAVMNGNENKANFLFAVLYLAGFSQVEWTQSGQNGIILTGRSSYTGNRILQS
ncbi:MAG: hypothetical protein IPF54_10570 [Draconibacterium sp.]|nr:hypothetical protein [Draconibacterium sp.]